MIDTPSSATPEPLSSIEEATPLPRMGFIDKGPIDGEPLSDVLIETDSGLSLRERMIETSATSDATLKSDASPTARTLSISNALLDADGAVEMDCDGKVKLASVHEVVLTNETLGRLGSAAAVEGAIRDAREIAAAQADMEFSGMRLFDQVLSARTRVTFENSADSDNA